MATASQSIVAPVISGLVKKKAPMGKRRASDVGIDGTHVKKEIKTPASVRKDSLDEGEQ